MYFIFTKETWAVLKKLCFDFFFNGNVADIELIFFSYIHNFKKN